MSLRHQVSASIEGLIFRIRSNIVLSIPRLRLWTYQEKTCIKVLIIKHWSCLDDAQLSKYPKKFGTSSSMNKLYQMSLLSKS